MPDEQTDFDRLSAGILAGRGVVARYPGVVCVAEAAAAEPVRALVALCAAVAGFEPGRPLARRLAAWLSGPDAPPSSLRFGTVADAGDRWVVFLSGAVSLHDAGTDATIPGAEAAAWTDRLVAPGGPFVLLLDAPDDDRPQGRADDPFADLHDLRAGAVPGRGAVLATASAARHTAVPPLPAAPVPEPPAPPPATTPPATDLGKPQHAEPTLQKTVPDEEPIEMTVGDGSGPPPVPPAPRDDEQAVRPPRRSALIAKAPAPAKRARSHPAAPCRLPAPTVAGPTPHPRPHRRGGTTARSSRGPAPEATCAPAVTSTTRARTSACCAASG